MSTKKKRLRYVCKRCGEHHVTAHGHNVHADTHHAPDEQIKSNRRWVVVE